MNIKQEIKSLTGIRGIAAVWVVLFHYFVQHSHFITNKTLITFFSYGHDAVYIFFILSAFVMCLAYQNTFSKNINRNMYITFMKKRFARIYPTYLFWIAVFCLLFKRFDALTLISNMLLLQNLIHYDYNALGVSWSLSCEWMVYFIFPFLFMFSWKFRNSIWVNIISILLAFVFIEYLHEVKNYYIAANGIQYFNPNIYPGVSGSSSIVRCILFYWVGISGFSLINITVIQQLFSKISIYTLMLPIVLLACFEGTGMGIVFLSLLLIMKLYQERSVDKGFFYSSIVFFLGKISFSLYMCHMVILFFISVVIKKIMPLQFVNYHHIIIIVSFLISILAAYLSYYFLENKASKRLKKLILRARK